MTETTMSDSFVEREKKEKEKLILSNSNKLREDLYSIFEREENFDLTLIYKDSKWNVHTAILEQRAPDFFKHLKDYGEEVRLKFLQEEDYGNFGNWLRALYTEDNLDIYEASVKLWISKLEKSRENRINNSDQDMINLQEIESIPAQPSTTEDVVEDVTSIINDKLSIDKQSDVPIQGSCTGDVMEVDASKRVETKFPSVPECCSRLGNDLISLLLSGKGADLELRVVDGAVMVHKFIVSGRTHYFAAMLSGAWSESSKPYIYLQNFSLSALLSILYYIYGGVLDIPETASICEVLVLADIYNLQAFKDVLMLRLKRENCHFFHKPCAECLAAVPEALALSVRFRDTNFTKACLRWMTKHFDKVWRSKSFAAMGKQLMEICYESALEELKPDTVVSLVTQSDKLLETLPRVKWNEPLVELVERLRDAALDYIAENFTVVSRHKNFQPLIQGMGWSCTLLELMFNKVVAVLNAKTANSVFMSANQLKRMAEMEEFSKGVCSVLVEFYYKCYTYMVSNANHQILSDDWNNLPEELKSKIKQDAVYVDERKKTVVPKPKLTSSSRPKTKPQQSEKPDATKSKGAKPKVRLVPTKPPEATKKTSVKPKTVNNPPSSVSASAPSKTNSLKPRGLKSESTKSKDSSAKSSKIQIQSRVLSSTSTKSTGPPAKPKESSKKPSGSTNLTAAKSKEVSVKVKKSAKAKEPLKDTKLPHRPPTAPGSLNCSLPVQPRKTNKEVKSRAATSVQLKKSNSLQKLSDESRPASSKTNTSLKSSKASLVSNGNISSKTQKVTKTSHDKPLDKKIKIKSRDVTATKDKTATKKKEDPLKNNGSSKPATEAVKKINAIPSTSSDVNTTNKEPSVAVNEANNMTQDASGKQEDKGDKAEQIDNTNSETEGKFDMVEDFDQLSGITENNITVRLPENSEEIDNIKFLKNEPSFCADGFKMECPLEKDDDLSISTTSLSNSEVLTGNVDNSLASLQSTEEKSRSSSQIPSETAIKCDDIFDEKSNNTEASDIAMDDCDPIMTSDNEVEQVDEEEEGMVSEDTNRISDNKAMELKINKVELDFEVPMDMTPDESEEVVNELSENKHECDYEASERRIEDGVKEKEPEYVEENDIHIAKAESSECAISKDDVLEHKDDSFTEHVFCEIKDNEHTGIPLPEEDNSADLSCFLERSNDCIEVEMDKDDQIHTSDHGNEDNMGSVSNKEISNENIDKEQFNATNDSIPFEDDNDLERETANIECQHPSEDRKVEPLPSVCEVHIPEADKKMLDNFSNDTTEREPVEEESQYKEDSCLETGGIDCVLVEATENKMAEHVAYSNDDKEATKDILYSQEENGVYTAEPDDGMMSNVASNGVQNGVDITGTYGKLDTDEEERGNGRLILSKALQFGSSNGASLEPES